MKNAFFFIGYIAEQGSQKSLVLLVRVILVQIFWDTKQK